jgi:hypothetical protein
MCVKSGNPVEECANYLEHGHHATCRNTAARRDAPAIDGTYEKYFARFRDKKLDKNTWGDDTTWGNTALYEDVLGALVAARDPVPLQVMRKAFLERVKQGGSRHVSLLLFTCCPYIVHAALTLACDPLVVEAANCVVLCAELYKCFPVDGQVAQRARGLGNKLELRSARTVGSSPLGETLVRVIHCEVGRGARPRLLRHKL